jgi:hypothetical protein
MKTTTSQLRRVLRLHEEQHPQAEIFICESEHDDPRGRIQIVFSESEDGCVFRETRYWISARGQARRLKDQFRAWPVRVGA